MTNLLKEILAGPAPVETLRSINTAGELASLEPALAELLMPIPAGYHHKDNLEHSLVVLQNSIDKEIDGPDLILRTAALFHDIGKPATRAFGKRGSVTFTNHDVVGARMVKKILPKHGYTKKETEQISRLVLMHMRSHTFKTGWSESAVRRMITDVGSAVQLDRLIIIFYSDATTKIDSRKASIHGNVALLAEELERVKAKDARASLRPALNGNEVAELLGLAPGPELGSIMKFLHRDENIGLSKADTLALIESNFA